MKIAEVRGLTPDQMSETLLNLKKEHSTCASNGPRVRWKKPTG